MILIKCAKYVLNPFEYHIEINMSWVAPFHAKCMGFPGGSVVKNPPANAEYTSSIPVSGKSPGEGNNTHFSVLAWEIPWTEEPDRPESKGSQRVGYNWVTEYTCTKILKFGINVWVYGYRLIFRF